MAMKTSVPATIADGREIVADQGDRRAVAGRGDDAGEGDVEEAVADDQAGREQHAHPLGEGRDRGSARRACRRAGRAPTPITTGKVTAIGR